MGGKLAGGSAPRSGARRIAHGEALPPVAAPSSVIPVPIPEGSRSDPSATHQIVGDPVEGQLIEWPGNQVRLRVLGPVEAMRMFRIAGKDSTNEAYMSMISMACMIKEHNGKPVPFPGTIQIVEQILGSLGTEGYSAIGKALEAQTKTQGELEEEVKN